MSTPRVTDADVKAILEDSSSAIGFSLAPFISMAHLFVEQRLGGQGLGEDLLTEIERLVAAHFTSLKRRRTTQERIGEATDTYALKVGSGLAATDYGQQALALDPTGRLAETGRPRAQVTAFNVLNKTVTEL